MLQYSFRIQQGSSQDYRTSNEEDYMVIKETWGRNLISIEVMGRCETKEEAQALRKQLMEDPRWK